MSYAEKLRDPRWQRCRLSIFERDGWSCRNCGSGLAGGRELHVHHVRYTAAEPWEEPAENLRTLCVDCHEAEHLLRLDPVWDLDQIHARVRLLRSAYQAAGAAVRKAIEMAEDLEKGLR